MIIPAQLLRSLTALAVVMALGVAPGAAQTTQDGTATGSQSTQDGSETEQGEGTAVAPSGEAAEGEALIFTHVLDDEPLEGVLTPREGEEFTEAVDEFHVTGENPYSGVDEAIAEGQDLFRQCQGCHGRGGSGGMGPALDDEEVRYERAATDKGMFEIIYGGAAGAMQPFGNRLTQDEILQLMAYIETFGER